MNKGGFSGLIVQLSLIVLCLGGTAIVSSMIFGVINEVDVQTPLDCIDMVQEKTFEMTSACYNVTSQKLEVSVVRNGIKTLVENLYFKVGANVETEVYCCGEDCESCSLQEEGSRIIYILNETRAELVDLNIDLGCEMGGIKVSVCGG